MNRIQKFIYIAEGEGFNPLAPLFFFVTGVFGVAFTFFGGTESVQTSPLYSSTEAAFAHITLPIWGVCAIMVTVVNTLAVIKLWGAVISSAAMLGFALWLSAAFVYLQDGLWFQLLVGALPNMAFWAWYYINVKYLVRAAYFTRKRP